MKKRERKPEPPAEDEPLEQRMQKWRSYALDLRAEVERLRLRIRELERALQEQSSAFEAKLKAAIGAAGVAARKGRAPLGPAEFEAIRAANVAEVSEAALAERYGTTVHVVQQIRRGAYPTRAFVAWLKEKGLDFNTPHCENQATVRTTWAPEPPEWILALAEECDLTSQGQTARRLGVSPAVVNQVLQRKYKGRYDLVEARIRGKLLPERSGSDL